MQFIMANSEKLIVVLKNEHTERTISTQGM